MSPRIFTAARLKPLLLASVLVLCLAVAPAVAVQAQQSLEAAPYPIGGIAVVDGDASEWNLTADFFATMHRASNPGFDVLSKLYLRYDCATQTLYLLVLAEPGVQIEAFHTAIEQWAKINNTIRVSNLSGNNGVAPDFNYINSDGTYADGWEASFILAPGGYTNFKVHAQVDDGDEDNQTSATPNISLIMDCTLGSIGDYVWHDADGQGDQDEPAANGLANIRVRLLNGTRTEVLEVDTTDANGYYLFVDLPAGDYVVDVNEQDVVDLYDLPTLTTNNEPYPYSLASGEHHRDADFGYWAPPGKVTLGDYVWHDFNSNGQQDLGEEPQNAGVRCISVFLYDADGNYLDRTNTDSWGIYMFYGLDPGIYTTAVHSADPDLEQINGILTCSLNDGTPPLTLTSARQRAPLAVFFTTATDLTFPVAPAGAVVLDFDYGISSTPLAVILAGFEAQQVNDRVLVTWETVSEANNAGFNLYRSDDTAGPQTLLAYVPSQAPGSTQGFAYSYEDLNVQPGHTYWYTLEDVSLSGSTTLHGPVSVTLPGPTAVTLSGVSASPAAATPLGGALLVLLAPLAGAAWAAQRRRPS